MEKHFAILHTTPATIAGLKSLCAQLLPGATVYNYMDDSLLPRINRAQAVTEEVRAQFGALVSLAASTGPAAILTACSTVGDLMEALRRLVDERRFAPTDVRLLLFGSIRQPELLQQVPVACTHLGYIDDEDQLSLVYSAANITVSSSLYETFGQTLIEAQSCGSLPISFDGSGQADIIDHLQTGFLARRLSAESLAEGIEWGLRANVDAQQLRRSVIRRYAESVVANQYIRLYNSLSPSQA
jgi:hypothetical protein